LKEAKRRQHFETRKKKKQQKEKQVVGHASVP
jgi:hypothetical protein